VGSELSQRLTGAERVARVLEAVSAWRARDAAGWGTGLSPEGARAAQRAAADAVLCADGVLGRALGLPPRRLVIWCAGNVFTAALEWTAIFAALGSEVVLKAPTRCPAPTLAMAEDFAALGVRAHALAHSAAWGLLEGADAVLGFGSDRAMQALSARLAPGVRRSLHGHRVSFAVITAEGTAAGAAVAPAGSAALEALAAGLALDAALYDGRGCMSPAAVFCLGDAEALQRALALALAAIARDLPRGTIDPAVGPEWRRRCGLARIVGRCAEGEGWAAPLLPADYALASPLPRMLPVHPLRDLSQLAPLAALPLSSCATNLPDPGPLITLGFDRICAPGALQAPPVGRPHDGVDVVSALSRQISLESLARR
jgi:hypothetical protein